MISLLVLAPRHAVARLEPGGVPAPLRWPDPPPGASFVSITVTPEEISLVGPEPWVAAVLEGHPPGSARLEPGWRGLRVEGAMDFDVVGVAAAIATPLAEAGISLLLLSTFDTDYLFVREENLAAAVAALRAAGHRVRDDAPLS